MCARCALRRFESIYLTGGNEQPFEESLLQTVTYAQKECSGELRPENSAILQSRKVGEIIADDPACGSKAVKRG